MISKLDARIIVTSEYSVASVILLLSVSAWLLFGSIGESAALVVGLESLFPLSIRMPVQQALVVWVFCLMHKQ